MKILKILKKWLRSVGKVFSPPYIYTLDKELTKKESEQWYFKEFGTHTYVTKTWQQMLCSNFLSKVKPEDVAYISYVESHRMVSSSMYHIEEQRRGGIYNLRCKSNNKSISIHENEFLRDRELIAKTEPLSVLQIAYRTGLMRGKKLSSCIVKQEVPVKKTPPLRIIK